MWQKDVSFSVPLKKLIPKFKPLTLVWINPGSFLMGSSGDKSDYVHGYEKPFKATISQGYWLGKFLVTQEQWDIVMGIDQSQNKQLQDLPVVNINREEALSFCTTLNNLFEAQLPSGYRFSLPTEMQWEFACRAGTTTKFYNGDDVSNLSDIAWSYENSLGHIHPVGEKEPNAWGLHDMLGNVFEWCYDFGAPYPSGDAVDWIGNANELTGMFRGGSSYQSYSLAYSVAGYIFYCSTRGYSFADSKTPNIGFRLCLRH
ncbi:MAG: SUMF1/EgtB/PvdO family nonheme iron enzyme [Anaerolineae bacterium]|nr:SUMF1/EgtB/PvdO family nonheme iron enzyme [Anaerolineae bacterium]